MLLGFSHIGFTVHHLKKAIAFFQKLRFTIKFVENDLLNAREKRSFLSHYTPKHSIAFLKGNVNSVGIELINYPPGAARPIENKLISTFDTYLRCFASGAKNSNIILSSNPQKTRDENYRFRKTPVGSIFIAEDNERCCVDMVILETTDIKLSEVFWTVGAGFKLVSNSGEYLELLPSVPIPNWQMSLRIKKSGKKFDNLPKLDTPGGNLISLITTDIESDCEKLKANGGTNLSEIFRLNVNGKVLKICLLYSLERQVLELIEFPRKLNRSEKNN